jgi:hypothetical protein
MPKILISVPDRLAARMKAIIPERQRSKIVVLLLETEIERRESKLYECALAVENDPVLKADMAAWDVTVSDGLQEEEQKQKLQSKEM